MATGHEEGQIADAFQTNSQRPGQQVTQGFSHLASTVPDSLGLQQSIDVSASFGPLAPPTNPLPSGKIPLKEMASQSSPHDTQELSPSYYVNLINVNKSKSALGLVEGGLSQNVDDGVTQCTTHTGDPGHIDLGLDDDSCDEDDGAQASYAELHSEPIEFSPTQATQNQLSQFPESQRFKTPATNGKKRNYLGEVIESPILPRNPFAKSGATKTPLHTLGLSQVFAGTQAGSSPIMTRHISEPTSDRPSPNIEMQARPATASLPSPLPPRSELQSRYVPIQQSQEERAERDRLAALERQSSDAIEAREQFDDDFDEEPSAVKRARRRRAREEEAREQFARFSSPNRRGSAAKAREQPARTARPQASSPIHQHSRRSGLLLTADQDAVPSQERVSDDSEDETDVEEEDRVVIRNSSQLPHENDEEDKENMHAKALQVPETVARLHYVVNGADERDMSPTLIRPFARLPVERLRSSQTTGQGTTDGVGVTGSPTVAIANSQPDHPMSRKTRKTLPQLGEPLNGFSGGLHVSSLAAGATIVESSPCRDESEQNRDNSRPESADDDITGEPQQQVVNQGHVQEPRDDETSALPAGRGPAALNAGPDSSRNVKPPRTLPETMSARGSTDPAQGSLDAATSVNGVPSEQQSSRYETAKSQLSSSTSKTRPRNSLFSSPSGRKRKRLGDIAAQPSPKKSRGEEEVEEVMAAMDDSEFYNAIGDTPGSSSPIPPGRNPKRRRFIGKQAVLSSATSASTYAPPPASSPTTHLLASNRAPDQAPPVLSSRTQPRPAPRSEAIWDVQTSPPKSAPARSMRNAAKGPRGSSGKNSNPLISRSRKQKGITAAETPQNDPYQEADPVLSVQDPRGTAFTAGQSHPRSGEVIAPNQVLACFNGNRRGYHPATCTGSIGLRSEGTFRYQIQWDESSRDEIDEHGIRRLDLHIGDQVKVNLQGWPRVTHVIQGFKDREDKVGNQVTDIRGFRTVLVKPKKRKSLPADVSTENAKEAPMSAIYLDTNMWGQMKDRAFHFDATHDDTPFTLQVPQQAPSRSGLTTPSERPSTPSTPSSRTRRKSDFPAQPASTSFPFPGLPAPSGIFSNMVFAISYDDDLRKRSLAKAILAAGGTLLSEDFHEMFEQQLTPTSPFGHAAETAPLTLNARFLTNGFTGLIADRHSRKSKYMQALALGIPSLSGRWVEACIAANKNLDWQPYLLSAGESLELEGAVRSRVLPPMDAKTTSLKDMISTRPNLLRGEAVIVVKGRGKAVEKRKPYIFLTKAAGAGRLETCVDLKSAKVLLVGSTEEVFSWVFVDDKELGKAEATLLPKAKDRQSKGLRVVGSEFLCQSLILGRLWEQS